MTPITLEDLENEQCMSVQPVHCYTDDVDSIAQMRQEVICSVYRAIVSTMSIMSEKFTPDGYDRVFKRITDLEREHYTASQTRVQYFDTSGLLDSMNSFIGLLVDSNKPTFP